MYHKLIDVGDIVCLRYDDGADMYVELISEIPKERSYEFAGYQIKYASLNSPVGSSLLGKPVGTKVALGKRRAYATDIYTKDELKKRRDDELYKVLCIMKNDGQISDDEFNAYLENAEIEVSVNEKCYIKKNRGGKRTLR